MIGSIGGVLVGFWFARQPRVAAVFDPYVKMVNALPRVVLAPIFTLWLGLGIWSKVALGVTLVFFIVFFNVYQGVKEVSPTVLANARMLGMSERQLMRHVYWPSALSWMFSSLHTSVGFAVVGAVVGEYLGSAAGLGYLIQQAEGVFDVAGVFAGMFVLAAFVIVIDRVVTVVERRLLVWRPGRGRCEDRDATLAFAGLMQARRGCVLSSAVRMAAGDTGRHATREAMFNDRPWIVAPAGFMRWFALGCCVGSRPCAQSKVTLAIGGASCLCYLPTMLAKQLGEYEKAGVNVELVDFKGGSEALKAVIGGSADVVSGYFDHCVNLAAKSQHLQSFVVYDRYPGFALVVSPKHTAEIKSIKDLADKKIGVSAPGSSTDFFLKYILKKNGVDPNSVGVIGVGLGATAIAAMEQGSGRGRHHARSCGHRSAGQEQGSEDPERHPHAEGHARRVRRRVSGRRALHQGGMDCSASEGSAGDDQRHRQHAEVDPLAHAGRDHGEDAGRTGRQGQGALSRRAEEHDPDVFGDRPHGPEGRAKRCSRCSASPRPKSPRPISTCRRPIPTPMSTRPTRRWE